jgi:outer membrane biosynthesis protein TonB
MGEARHSRSLIIIFIIILLLHIFTLWVVFITSFNHSDIRDLQVPPLQEIAQQKNQPVNSQTWKALHAKPSAPVIFKNPQTASDSGTRATPVPELPAEKDPIPKPLIPEKPKTAPLDKPLITDIHGKVPILTQQEKPEQKHQTNQPLVKAPRIPEKTEPQKSEAQQITSAEPPKKFSFNTLAQGFAQHMHDQGTDQYSMRGKEKGKATAEQLKYAQYASKICSTITNAFVTNKRKLLFTSYAKHDAIIKVIINKDGTLKDALVVKSSTVPAIDLSIITVIKEAAHGFPPLPEFFGMEHFPLTIVFNNTMQIIEHPEQSYWSL